MDLSVHITGTNCITGYFDLSFMIINNIQKLESLKLNVHQLVSICLSELYTCDFFLARFTKL